MVKQVPVLYFDRLCPPNPPPESTSSHFLIFKSNNSI